MKKTRRKTLCLLMLSAIVLTMMILASCGNNPNDSSTKPNENSHEHTYGEWIVETSATCTTDGSRYAVCTECGETKSEAISKLGHDYVNQICSRCDNKKPSEGLEFSLSSDEKYYYVSGIGRCNEEQCIGQCNRAKQRTYQQYRP